MKLTYEVTIEDIINFNVYHHLNSETERKRRLREKVFFVLWTLLIYFIFNYNNISYKSFAIFIPVFLFGAFMIFLSKKYRIWLVKRQTKSLLNEGDNIGFIGNHTLEISDNILTFVNQQVTSQINLATLVKVVQNERYVYIYTNSISAIVIPKEYLSDEVKDELIKIITDKITS